MSGVRGAFLDLNGTLVMPVQVNSLSEHVLIPESIEAIKLLAENGFVCPVITVQSRISKGVFSLSEFLDWFTGLQRTFRVAGVEIRGPYACPHRFGEPCPCEKPKPYLYRLAAKDLDIDMTRSVVIGDTASDVMAAKSLGCSSCLVRTGWGERSIERHQADELADFVAGNVLEAAKWAVLQSPG